MRVKLMARAQPAARGTPDDHWHASLNETVTIIIMIMIMIIIITIITIMTITIVITITTCCQHWMRGRGGMELQKKWSTAEATV